MIRASASWITVAGAWPAIAAATARSTSPTLAAGSERDMAATLRATHGSHSNAWTRAQVAGSRCCRSRMSASRCRVVNAWVSRAIASSGRQNSRTAGVPSPPGSVIGSRSPAGSPCSAAQWAADPHLLDLRRPTHPTTGHAANASVAAASSSSSSGGKVVVMDTFYSNTSSNKRPGAICGEQLGTPQMGREASCHRRPAGDRVRRGGGGGRPRRSTRSSTGRP